MRAMESNRAPILTNYRGGAGRVWTQADHDELKRLYALGCTFSEIGAALKRSPGNCVAHVALLKLPPRDRAAQCLRGFENLVTIRARELLGTQP